MTGDGRGLVDAVADGVYGLRDDRFADLHNLVDVDALHRRDHVAPPHRVTCAIPT